MQIADLCQRAAKLKFMAQSPNYAGVLDEIVYFFQSGLAPIHCHQHGNRLLSDPFYSRNVILI